MATFYNQATLSYNGRSTMSNITVGELQEALTLTKTAVSDTYTAGERITYVLTIVNGGTGAFTGLTLTDDLGAYTFGETATLVPMEYVDGTLLYYINGVLQAAPAVTAGPPLSIEGISVPAGGNATLVYEAELNDFAPLGIGGSVTNTAAVTGGGLTAPITAEETITADTAALLSISKTLTPTTVSENGQLTYTFVIRNTGSTAVTADDLAAVTDTFDPALAITAVTFEGTAWAEPTNYSYTETSGEFATVPGQITVPAATVTQDPATGAWSVTPGMSVLTVTGII